MVGCSRTPGASHSGRDRALSRFTHLGSADDGRRLQPTRPTLPFVIVISSDPSLDPILASESIVRTSRPTVRSDSRPRGRRHRLARQSPQGVPHAEARELVRHHRSPPRALQRSGGARRIGWWRRCSIAHADLFYSTYDNLHPRIEEGELRPRSAALSGAVLPFPPVSHRQSARGPTMSWHRSTPGLGCGCAS